ncbi:unnamed protein product [Rotaria socialis]|uniref:Wax synthase domain-containing protein n=2 Tax=Rotaria socialis TaxID=392032 RepID=A0A817L6G9_9BILA|nr:unnamed protein product [Rotaria socialis]CAF4235142.1 unnamed protein product [Rotaria socialis]
MIEIGVFELWFLDTGIIFIFVIGFLVCKRWNSKRLFHGICIVCSLIIFSLPLVLKWYSPWPFASVHVLFLSAITSLILVLKFLEWGFARDWNEIRTVPIKQLIIDFTSYSQLYSSTEKQSSLTINDIYRMNTTMLLRGVFQFITLRILMHLIPDTWLSLALSSLTFWIWPIRYILLSFILYISISAVTNITFSVSAIIWTIPVQATFPAFPFTSCSIREFWSRRWNLFVKHLLHRISFIVIPNWVGVSQTMSNTIRGLISFVLSGILHELLFVMSTGQWSGKNLAFFLLHAVLVTIEIIWDRRRRTVQSTQQFFRWLQTMAVMLITSPLFFDPWIEAGYFIALKQSLSWS